RFYDNLNAALSALREEADHLLKKGDITNYIKVKDRVDEIERDFRALFQRRFEKIASLSIYDLDSELMSSLTPEEKDFITKLHNLMIDQYNLLLKKYPSSNTAAATTEMKTEQATEAPGKTDVTIEDNQAEEIPTRENAIKPPDSEYILVRIIGDQPPIAQPDRDYFLHDQDVLYLEKKFAELLIRRNAAKKNRNWVGV
ncbi:MAG: hypothetical protein QW812_02005, partial [Thermoplasmataceae archaeon]